MMDSNKSAAGDLPYTSCYLRSSSKSANGAEMDFHFPPAGPSINTAAGSNITMSYLTHLQKSDFLVSRYLVHASEQSKALTHLLLQYTH